MNGSFNLILYEISIWAISAIIAITFHEASHGYVAHLLGDDTAWRWGRVSFNPLVHIDPFGTIGAASYAVIAAFALFIWLCQAGTS